MYHIGQTLGKDSLTMENRYELNKNLAQMLKGGVIMDVTTPEQAKIAEAAGACAVMALERIPADIRAAGGVSRMSDPKMIKGIQEAVSIPIEEEQQTGRASSFTDCVKLLAHPAVLLSFLGIMCHVGIDVGTNATAPKILMERLGMSLHDAAFATSLYFAFRTLGSLTGSFLLRIIGNRTFFLISVIMMGLSMLGMAFGESKTILYIAIALVGFGNSNIFPLVFSHALKSDSSHENEISGLMIMGLFGGTVFPLLMGFASDAAGQIAAVGVMAIGVIYLFTFMPKIKNEH